MTDAPPLPRAASAARTAATKPLPEARLQPLLEGRERFLAYLRQRLAAPEVAEDVLQASLLRAFQAAPPLDSEERLVAWFYRVLQNAIVDTYRRRAVEQRRMVQLDATDELAAPPSGADEAVLCACLEAVLPALRPEYGALLRTLDLDGEAPEAAAAKLGITRNNLKVRHHRARQALRRRLEETCRVCATHNCLDCTCGASGSGGAGGAGGVGRASNGAPLHDTDFGGDEQEV